MRSAWKAARRATDVSPRRGRPTITPEKQTAEGVAVTIDTLRRSSAKTRTIQSRLAWPLRMCVRAPDARDARAATSPPGRCCAPKRAALAPSAWALALRVPETSTTLDPRSLGQHPKGPATHNGTRCHVVCGVAGSVPWGCRGLSSRWRPWGRRCPSSLRCSSHQDGASGLRPDPPSVGCRCLACGTLGPLLAAAPAGGRCGVAVVGAVWHGGVGQPLGALASAQARAAQRPPPSCAFPCAHLQTRRAPVRLWLGRSRCLQRACKKRSGAERAAQGRKALACDLSDCCWATCSILRSPRARLVRLVARSRRGPSLPPPTGGSPPRRRYIGDAAQSENRSGTTALQTLGRRVDVTQNRAEIRWKRRTPADSGQRLAKSGRLRRNWVGPK